MVQVFPFLNIETVEEGDWKRERFKAKLNFAWLNEETSQLATAPHAQLILYPKYPEVRFSGFLLGCPQAPSSLMAKRIPDRLLFLSVSNNGRTLGYVVSPTSEVAQEFRQLKTLKDYGVFKVMELPPITDSKNNLLKELRSIHQLGWIDSKRLDAHRNILPCKSANCGGYTLEAELGVTPNGHAEPDFMGWEIKQFGVRNFDRIDSSIITLMTPEPTHGIYKSEGAEYFVETYGYFDKKGRPDRMNFGGIHRVGQVHQTTNLEIKLIGFDHESGKIRHANGRITLLDGRGNEAASWSYSSLLLHWNRKHHKACYIPSISQTLGNRKYRYGGKVFLGMETVFQRFLKEMALGNIYYDPGIKMENLSTKPKIKKRSQFRIKSRFLTHLYAKNEFFDIR